METQYLTLQQESHLSRPRLSSQGSSSSTPYSILNKSLTYTLKQAKSAKVSEIVNSINRNQLLDTTSPVVPSLESKSPSNWKNYMNEQSLLSTYSSLQRNNPMIGNINNNESSKNPYLTFTPNSRNCSLTPNDQYNCSFNEPSLSKSRSTQIYNINSNSKSNFNTEQKPFLSTKTDSTDESGLQATNYVLAKEIEKQTVQLDQHDKQNTNLRKSNQQLQEINISLISRVHTSEAGIKDLSQKVHAYEQNILMLDEQISKAEEKSSKAINEVNNQIIQAQQDKQQLVEESMQKLTSTFLKQQKEQESTISELESLIRQSANIQTEQEKKNQQLQVALKEFQEKYDRLEVVCREGAHLEKENRILQNELNKHLDQKDIEQENNELRQQLNDTQKEIDSLKDTQNTLLITQKDLIKTELCFEGLKSAVAELHEKNIRQNNLLNNDSQHINKLETEIAQIKEDNHVFKVSLDANHKECEELFNDFKLLKKNKVSLKKGYTTVYKGTNQSIGFEREDSVMSRSQKSVILSSGLFF